MESQQQVFTRLFVIPSDDPETRAIQKECLDRVQELFGRETFDDDCAEFHRWYTESGLDFARCWVSLRCPQHARMEEYNMICKTYQLV
jgi:hypothetical protein